MYHYNCIYSAILLILLRLEQIRALQGQQGSAPDAEAFSGQKTEE